MKNIIHSSFNAAQEAGLRRYATLGLGTAVLAGAVTTADASVVYTNYNNTLLTDTNTADTSQTIYGFDVNGDGSQDFRFFIRNEGSTSSSNYAIIVGGVNGTQIKPINAVGVSANGFAYPSRLTGAAVINAARPFITLGLTSSGYYLKGGTFAFGNGFTNSKWKTAGANQGYLGFSFTAADGLHYGFAGLTVEAQGLGGSSRAISLGGIGYETVPNTAITTSGSVGVALAVPEPSSLALLAAGGLGGIAAFRRRQRAKATAVGV